MLLSKCTKNLTIGALTECILSDVSSPGVTMLPRSPETRSMTQSRLALKEATAAEAVSSPETRFMARSRCAASEAQSSSFTMSTSKKASSSKKQGKGTVPSFVAHDGTYYRAINVWFDERNWSDIMTMGASPSIQDLDTRQFAKRRLMTNYCLHTWTVLLRTMLSTMFASVLMSFWIVVASRTIRRRPLMSWIRNNWSKCWTTLYITTRLGIEIIKHPGIMPTH